MLLEITVAILLLVVGLVYFQREITNANQKRNSDLLRSRQLTAASKTSRSNRLGLLHQCI